MFPVKNVKVDQVIIIVPTSCSGREVLFLVSGKEAKLLSFTSSILELTLLDS